MARKLSHIWQYKLTLCLMGSFPCFLSSADVFYFSKYYSRFTITVSNILDPDQAQRFVWSVLVLNCLQKLLAVDICR